MRSPHPRPPLKPQLTHNQPPPSFPLPSARPSCRLREQLEMAQQELEELRARGGGGPADSEEGWAEHSEGSLPGDLSVMQHHHSQHHHSQAL